MPLPLPNLDDRRWAELTDEGAALIPRHAPSWTDHNFHDPGRTLLELFGWLTELAIYRLNRVPERHLRKFLGLIGILPRAPRAARAILDCTPPSGTASFTLPADTEFETSGADDHIVPFRTLRELTVSVVTLRAVSRDDGAGGRLDL